MQCSIMTRHSSLESYTLSVNSQITLHVIASLETENLINLFGRVFGLEPCSTNNIPKLLLTRCTPECDDCREHISHSCAGEMKPVPVSGWKSEELLYAVLWRHPEIPDIFCQIQHMDCMMSDMARIKSALNPVQKKAIKLGGGPLHAGLIEISGHGIAIAGHGDIGKSTFCSRVPDSWNTLCDDETLIIPENNRYTARPFPTWSDYLLDRPTQPRNISKGIPLTAIFFLKRSEKDRIVPMGEGEAAVRINESAKLILKSYWLFNEPEGNREMNEAIFQNACRIAREIPAYTLHFTRTGECWEEIEQVLSED